MSSRRDLTGALAALLRLIDISDTVAAIRNGSVYKMARDVLDRADRGLIEQAPWTPFEERTHRPLTTAQIKAFMKQTDLSEAQVLAHFAEQTASKLFVNSRYQVLLRESGDNMVYLSIKRLDQTPIHDWRDLQRCKDELVGPECEAIELYPARSRLMDASNQYHLWAVADPKFRFPVGFQTGEYSGSKDADEVGASQRPIDPE
jgi:hypothetical protein